MAKRLDLWIDKSYLFCSRFVIIFCGGIFSLLTLFLFIRFGFPYGLGILVLAALFFFLLYQGGSLWEKKAHRKYSQECFLVLWYLVLGAIWALCSKSTMPHGDQASVFQIASDFSAGNYAAVEPDGYLSSYPQQLGIIIYYELFLRILKGFSQMLMHVGTTDLYRAQYMTLYLVQVVLVALFALFSLKVTKQLFSSPKTHFRMVCMIAGCGPLFLYILFLYGDVLSWTFLMAGTWALLVFLKTGKWVWGLPSLLCIVLSVLARKTGLIYVIACVLVLLLHSVRRHQPRFVLFALGLATMSLSVLPLTIKYYEYQGGQELSGEVAASAFVAMGLQESPGGYGINNGFEINTHITNHYDTRLTTEDGMKSIRESLDKFRKDPGYMLYFFYQKISHEWTDSDFEGFILTDNYYESGSAVQKLVYENPITHGLLSAYMNAHKLLVFVGTICFMVLAKGKRESGELLFPIGIIGGFLFYIAWESSCRYVLPFFLMAIPYACEGLSQVGEKIAALLMKSSLNERYH
jgi:hypothetical protein